MLLSPAKPYLIHKRTIVQPEASKLYNPVWALYPPIHNVKQPKTC